VSRELLDIAQAAARSAAAIIGSSVARGITVATTKSSPVDVVTEADRSAERLIRREIGRARPDDAFVGEEGDDVAGTSGVRWIIDPVDGTVNLLYGIPHYAVSIAAELDGEVVAGVVRNAATGVEYSAYADEAGELHAERDGHPIRVRATVPLAERLIGTGFSYEADIRELQAKALVRLIREVRDIRRLGSCALDLCGVAEGTLDGYAEEGVNLWDHAAGGLIARAAGATVELGTGVGGKTLVMCAPTAGFPEFRDAIASAGYLSPRGE
jgi:myo-inositol-1(or 4)-monophosphatase